MADTFGQRLRAARKRAGYRTQDALGDVVNRSGKMIRLYETDKQFPPPEVMDALRQALGSLDFEGDEVEAAIANSELIDWRQDAVRSVYRRNLREQREGRAG